MVRIFLGGACLLLAVAAWANDAEIVSIIGQGEARPAPAGEWKPAVVKQTLAPGAFVRTRDLSQIALLLQDRTQLRLNQNSMVQIKEIAQGGAPTRLELSQGRIWAQAKPRALSLEAASAPALTVHTPNAIAAIRGTDWDLAVDADGGAILTVLSGVVDFYNDYGRISVRPNEQARVQAGQAPTKILLTHARERVQWVTAYRPQARRWVQPVPPDLQASVKAIEEGRYGEALAALEARRAGADADTALLLADLYLSLGRVAEAVAALQAHAERPRVAALLARALLLDDRADAAERVLATALREHPQDQELLLARGDLARFNGDAPGAMVAYRRVLADRPENAEAWFGLGRVEAEREAVREGRAALGRAIAISPDGPGYQGELATLESYAYRYAAAAEAFQRALAQQADDYVALTGLGILQLKRGEAAAALASFLKSGVIEAHYARSALYAGVATYQLGDYGRAMEMFGKAAEQDPRDPLPHLMMSLAAADRLELGEAVAAARRGAERMPYLKSLNQLQNDRKGNANIGYALAQFGMEDWARAYAHDSYSPYWAGSHLFLSDRYSGEFTKNSELFMGFLSDPTVFGASNRHNTLVASPGHYATVGARLSQGEGDARVRGLTLNANGYSAAALPFSYYIAADPVRARPGRAETLSNGDNYTVGLGLKPSLELGLFLFANRLSIDAGSKTASGVMPYDITLGDSSRRLDIGASYKPTPVSQFWLKAGRGKEESRYAGRLTSAPLADSFNLSLDAYMGWGALCAEGVPGGCYAPQASIGRYLSGVDQDDWQLRQSVDISANWQLSWGVESGRQRKPADLRIDFPAQAILAAIPTASLSSRGEEAVRTLDAYLSSQFKLDPALLIQADLYRSTLSQRVASVMGADLALPYSAAQFASGKDREIAEWNPRLGLTWKPAAGQTLRLALQRWRRPAAVNTLGPVDSAGIVVDDRMVALGGKEERFAAQYEWETTRATFVQVFADSKRVRNLNDAAGTTVSDLGLEDLKRLTSRNQLLPLPADFWEATPLFGAADIDSAGFAVNRMFSDQVSGNLRYTANHSRNRGLGLEGKQVPWLPSNLFSAGLNWLPAARWKLALTATHRSSRYSDEANTVPLNPGWNLELRSYWESLDKRWSLEAVAQNLHADKAAAATRSAILGLQVLHRF